jgi:hypothetical protein
LARSKAWLSAASSPTRMVTSEWKGQTATARVGEQQYCLVRGGELISTSFKPAKDPDGEELNVMLNDWRNFRIVRDLTRYLKAVRSVSKVKDKVAGVPMLTSNRRMDRAARSDRVTRSKFEQFTNTGRLDDAAAIIAQRMKD